MVEKATLADKGDRDLAIVRGSGTIPIPDPTELTTKAVAVLETHLKELFEVRFKYLEGANDRHQDVLDGTQKAINAELAHLRELMIEKFKGVADQFSGRDTALAAALLAQKTSVEEQNKSNALSASKAEAGFTKEIDAAKASGAAQGKAFDDKIGSLGDQITLASQTVNDKIEDIRTRVGAMENQKKGASDNTGTIIGVAGVIIAVVTMFGAIGFTAFGKPSTPVVVERSAAGDKVLQ